MKWRHALYMIGVVLLTALLADKPKARKRRRKKAEVIYRSIMEAQDQVK